MIFTSEQVSSGHPDKICDQISDAIVTDCLQHDKLSRVAVECMIKDYQITIAGEITSSHLPNYELLTRTVLNRIGLPHVGRYQVRTIITQQSPDIALGVDGNHGAGDQGMMFGYATDETPEMLPIPFAVATRALQTLREFSSALFLPDAKAQVSFDYDSWKITSFLISTQHQADISVEELRPVVEAIMETAAADYDLNTDFERLVNPTGRFVITSVNDGKNYVFSQDAVDQFGWVWATNTWDDVTVPANLKTKAEEWLSSTQFETMSLKLTAADLSELGHDYDAFAEGDRIHCLAKPYGMDIVLPVMKLTIPLQNPAGRTLELSSKQQKTYTSQQSAVRNQLRSEQNDAISISNRNIQISIDNLTAMMTGAKGGYKLTEYDEDGRWLRDLYMDTPDKTTAKRVMQINKDGIAASTTGYEGPYTVGITVDGQILGSWIAANSIDTNQLSIGLNNWIKGTDDGIASKVEKDGIISAINQSSEEVAIQAQRINLNGAITANNYFKIKTDGSMEAIAGQIGGFNINSDYIAFGDWTHASNWLSMCTPHGGAGDVYLGKGGISTDSFDGQSGSIVRSIKMTEGTIGFYKGAYECGFVGVSDSNEIKMSLMDKEKNDILNVHHDWLELPVFTQVSGDLSVLGSKARCVKTRDYGERKLYAYETPTPYFGDIGEGVIAEDGLCYVSIDPVFAQCVSLEGYQVFLQAYGLGEIVLTGRYSDHFVVSGTPGLSFGWEMKAKQIDYDQLRMTEERGQVDTSTTNYGAEAASYLAFITEGRITT